ncbi:hypothetical protein HanPSC8_Chr16g0699381 [Helianthus annuus]|nr:hypothetical protein HanPSC8_Chr16g0699381 [Helianthus annuus]
MAYTEESMTPVFASLLKSGIQIFIFWHGLDYEKSKVDHEGLKLKMKSSKIQFEVELLEMQIPLQRDYKESDEKHGILRKRLSDDHSKIVYCIDELGLLCAYEIEKSNLVIKEIVKENDEEKERLNRSIAGLLAEKEENKVDKDVVLNRMSQIEVMLTDMVRR